MNSRHPQLKQHLGLVSAICGSLVISSLPAIAQTRPNPSTMNQADLERICTDYRATRDDGTTQAQMNRTPASEASSDVVRDRTSASSTDTTTSRDRPASSTTNRTGSSDRTASSTTNRTGSSDRISAENFSREELDRMCANYKPSENPNKPSTESDNTPGDNMNQQSVPPARTAPENQPSRTNQQR